MNKVPSDARQFSVPREQDAHAVSRRDLLTGAAASLACAFVPATLIATADLPHPAELFTASERRSLEAAASRIIPGTPQSLGALEAGCARYIELSLADAYRTLQVTYRAGLAALDAHANSTAGKPFAALDASQQDKLLADFEQNVKVGDFTASGAFFELLRRHTLEGMFGDPIYGGNTNFAGWDLIRYPGPRMLVKPAMQTMDAKIPRSGFSVKQLAHGSR